MSKPTKKTIVIPPVRGGIEGSLTTHDKLQKICRDLLIAIGEEPDREGLIETPRRFANMWQEFVNYKPGKLDTVFESVTIDQMVVLRDIQVWSMCEHHLLPFKCNVSISYISSECVIGISKLARIAKKHSKRLQLQERLCKDIADELSVITQTKNVAVIARGIHLCMQMRGIESGAEMISSDLRGLFRYSDAARAEVMRLSGF